MVKQLLSVFLLTIQRFRWAALHMEELKMRRILRSKEIRNTLLSLPKDLDSTYERILTNIDPSLTNEAMSVLQWLACASRPLFLEELAEARIIRPGDSDPFDEDQRISPLDILEVLPGLTKVDPAPDPSTVIKPRRHTISLAHFSVKEYLFSERILQGPGCGYQINSGWAN